MRRNLSILDLLSDKALFRTLLGTTEWRPWRAFLAALFGLPPEDDTAATLIRQCTGRSTLPSTAAREAFCIVGRRGGKSRIAALLAVYLACFRRYRLAPGERGVVMVIAADRKQARVVFRYVLAFLNAVPMLAQLIARRTKESIDLSNGISIEVHTASFRAIRGYTVVGAILDEIAFWPTDDAANPDTEILNALRPAMATVPGALLMAISSPYARRGELYRAYRDHYGKDDSPVLVWNAATLTMNPTVPEAVVAAAYEQDEASASAEYGAQFRKDIEGFITREALHAVTAFDRRELPRVAPFTYYAFVDPSGGAADSFTLAIAHAEPRGDEQQCGVLDVLREVKPPFSPERTVAEFAELLKTYGVTSIEGDRYAGEWPREQFRKHGIDYQPSDKTKSDLYRELLPLLNSGRVELLDHPRLRAQLASLERRTARGGRDSIDHPPGAHDDVANAAAGALVLAAQPYDPVIFR